MTLDYIYIPMQILTLKGYSASKKILLSLVASFNSKGLRMSNDALAEILDVRADSVSKLLSDLESGGDIEIKNRQSKYRAIYFGEKSKVKDILLREKVQSKKVLLRDLPQSTLEKSPNITKVTKERHSLASQNSLCDETFQRFYAAYPKKAAKAEAQKSWVKLNPSPELVEQIIAAVEKQKQTPQWLKEDGRFIPHPATWLNQRRWEDEIPENQLPTHAATEEEITAAYEGGGT